MKLLYVSWDGPTNSYLESLFFPLFTQLSRFGIETHVLQFSWDLPSFQPATARAAAAMGIGYEALAVPRKPIQAATALAISTGALQLARVARRLRADVVMPRAHIPGAMALAAKPLLGNARLVWDSDGLMPDERVDFGGWSRDGINYRLLRRVERRLTRTAAATITRTAAAKRILEKRATTGRLFVVPNGKDPDTFRPATVDERHDVRADLGLSPDAPLLAYVGSIGPQYHPRAMARLFAAVRRRHGDAHFLCLTGDEAKLRDTLKNEGVLPSSTVRQVRAAEVAGMLRSADAGISFREPTLSMRGVCPIKVAEYLLSGVPVLGNTGIGDLDAIFNGSAAGHLVSDFSDGALDQLASWFVDLAVARRPTAATTARALGIAEFSLSTAARRYAEVLDASLR